VQVSRPKTLFGRAYVFEQGMIINTLDDTTLGLQRIIPEHYPIAPRFFPAYKFKELTLKHLERARSRLDRLIAGEVKPKIKGRLL